MEGQAILFVYEWHTRRRRAYRVRPVGRRNFTERLRAPSPEANRRENPVLQSEAELPPATPLVPASQSETEAQPAAPLVLVVPTKTTVPTPLPAVPMQKEMLVSTTTNEAPKTPDVTKCDDPLKVVHKYKAYFRIESQRYQEGLRPKPSTFKATMPEKWL